MMDNFHEKMKLETGNWFKRGVGGRRDSEEISAYLEGVENATTQVLESIGRTSVAVYEANSIGAFLDDYIHDELLEMKEDENEN